jgi:transposase
LRGSRIAIVAATGVLAVVGVLLAVIRPWDSEPDEFCTGIEQWHNRMNAFLIRVNQDGARRGDGLRDTYDVFLPAAASVIPRANNDSAEGLRALVFETVEVHELWLSDLSRIDIIRTSLEDNPDDGLRAELLRRDQDAEAKRVEANDLMRRANPNLKAECDLSPLEIYSE